MKTIQVITLTAATAAAAILAPAANATGDDSVGTARDCHLRHGFDPATGCQL